MSSLTMEPQEYLDSLAKPANSLGVLEEWAATLCKVQSTLKPKVDSMSILVFCADHGIKKDDFEISPYPQSVTQAVFRALAAGVSGTATLSRSVGAHLTIVDCGIDGDVSDLDKDGKKNSLNSHVSVCHNKIAHGTANITGAPAMTEKQLDNALQIGGSCVLQEAQDRKASVVGVGEAGIGNTTIASALLCALTGSNPEACCGRGTGLDEKGLTYKIKRVSEACTCHQKNFSGISNEANRTREILRCLGGFEIAAMVGAYLKAHDCGVVAMVDGFISAVAALCAIRMQPQCRSNLVFATALEEEPKAPTGGRILAHALGNPQPALSMKLCLGEASAAALALPILRASAEMVSSMATLEDVLKLMPSAGSSI